MKINAIKSFLLLACFLTINSNVFGLSPLEIMPIDTIVYDTIDEIPRFSTKPEGLQKFLASRIQFRGWSKKELEEIKPIVVNFIVEIDGSLSNIKIKETCQDEKICQVILKAFDKFPKWAVPGKKNGKAVRCYFRLPISPLFLEFNHLFSSRSLLGHSRNNMRSGMYLASTYYNLTRIPRRNEHDIKYYSMTSDLVTLKTKIGLEIVPLSLQLHMFRDSTSLQTDPQIGVRLNYYPFSQMKFDLPNISFGGYVYKGQWYGSYGVNINWKVNQINIGLYYTKNINYDYEEVPHEVDLASFGLRIGMDLIKFQWSK